MKTEFLPPFLRLVLSFSVLKIKAGQRGETDDRVYGEEKTFLIELLKTKQDTSNSFKTHLSHHNRIFKTHCKSI